jgi:hypothetical protein
MPALTLEDLRSRARRLAGVDMVELWSDAQIDEAVNEAYHEILEVERWDFLDLTQTFDTVEGDAAYELPVALARVGQMRIVTGDGRGDLRPRQWHAKDELDLGDSDRTDTPTEYVLRSPRAVELFPTPDAVYTVTVDGRRIVADLAAGQEPVFDQQFHPAVAYLAAIGVLDEEGDDSLRSERYAARVDSYVERMREHYQLQHNRNPMIMGGRRMWRQRRNYMIEGL